MTDKRYTIKGNNNGFMVLDYKVIPEMDKIYDEPKDYQIVIGDLSQSQAWRVCELLNSKEDKINEVQQELEDYENTVVDFLFENMNVFTEDQIMEINNIFAIDLIGMFQEFLADNLN